MPARVLFVTAGVPHPRDLLVRLVKLTEVFDAELHVLSVVATAHRMEGLVRSRHYVYDGASLEHYLDECRRLQAWCQDLVPAERWQVRVGDLLEEAAIHAHALQPDLLVSVPEGHGFGPSVTALARATGVPMLLSRATIAQGRPVLAATDLLGPKYPVLDLAAELGGRLLARVVAVHDAARRRKVDSTRPSPDRRAQLFRVASERAGDIEAVVAREGDPVRAIMYRARAEDAGLILVGTRRHSWLHRLRTESVSARVVHEARRSVLVVPIDS